MVAIVAGSGKRLLHAGIFGLFFALSVVAAALFMVDGSPSPDPGYATVFYIGLGVVSLLCGVTSGASYGAFLNFPESRRTVYGTAVRGIFASLVWLLATALALSHVAWGELLLSVGLLVLCSVMASGVCARHGT
jgi:hypothetical protein